MKNPIARARTIVIVFLALTTVFLVDLGHQKQ